MRMTPLPLIATTLLVAAAAATAAPNPCSDGNCTVTPPNAWAKVRAGLGTSVPLAFPRATQGAVLQRLTLSTAADPSSDPDVDSGDATLSCPLAEVAGTYRTRSGGQAHLIIGASELTSPGCAPTAVVGYRCARGRLAGARGTVLSCRGPRGRHGLAWSGPSWGYWLDAPSGFPLAAMAASTR
jgi:hypothetical protein